MTNYIDESQRFLDAALASQLALREEYALPVSKAANGMRSTSPGPFQDPTKIAALHQSINYGLKCAEVSALIGIAHRLEDIVAALEPQTFEEHASQALSLVIPPPVRDDQ